jgi:hypothetical protein
LLWQLGILIQPCGHQNPVPLTETSNLLPTNPRAALAFCTDSSNLHLILSRIGRRQVAAGGCRLCNRSRTVFPEHTVCLIRERDFLVYPNALSPPSHLDLSSSRGQIVLLLDVLHATLVQQSFTNRHSLRAGWTHSPARKEEWLAGSDDGT